MFSLIFTAAATLTINTNTLVMSGTLTLPNAAVTFAGTAGFTTATLTNTSYNATRITTFTAALVYTVTTAFSNVGTTAAIRQTLTAANATTFLLNGLATQDIGYADPTNMNAAGGQTIFSFRGTITTSTNWSVTLPVNNLPPQIVKVPAMSSF